MTKYLITLGAHAMDDIPEHDMTAVAAAAHAVTQQAINAGVFVLAGGLQDQPASMVSPDGSVADGPRPEAIGGFMVVDVSTREEALAGPPRWRAHVAAHKRSVRSDLTRSWTRRFARPRPRRTSSAPQSDERLIGSGCRATCRPGGGGGRS